MFCDSSWELWLHSMVCPWAREVTRNAAAVAGAKGQKTSAFAFFLHVEVTAEGGHKRSALCSQLWGKLCDLSGCTARMLLPSTGCGSCCLIGKPKQKWLLE